MLLGIFGSASLDSLESRYAKLELAKSKLRNEVKQAVADRTAAVAELSKEISKLGSLEQRL